MILSVYSIRDNAAEAFQTPWFHHNDATAERQFEIQVRDDESIYGKSKEDFALFRIGTFDSDSGEISGEMQPIKIKNAMAFHPLAMAGENLKAIGE